MNIENRLKLFRTEKTKILGFGRSHLRSVELARRLETDVEKKIRKAKRDFSSKQAFYFYLWDVVKERGDELLRREHFQFRVFDDGTVEFLDQNFIKRPGNGFSTRYEDVATEMEVLPEKVRAVLQLHYQSGLGCKAISKRIDLPVEEVYQLWQHSLIYLWEALQNGENEDFKEQDDEAFWTLALKYLDGTASEKFVAELNSEIHVSKTRTKQYNDLRMIDGIMIGFGNLDLWPKCDLVEETSVNPAKKLLPATKALRGPDEVEKTRKDEPPQFAIWALGFLATLFEKSGRIVEKLTPKKRGKETPKQAANPAQSLQAPAPEVVLAKIEEPEAEKPEPKPPVENERVLAKKELDGSRRHGVLIDNKPRLPKISVDPVLLRRLGILALIGCGVGMLALVAKNLGIDTGRTSPAPTVLRSSEVEFLGDTEWDGKVLKPGSYHMAGGTLSLHTADSIGLLIEAPAQFEIVSGHQFKIKEGRVVATVPAAAPAGFEIESSRFRFSTTEGEIAVISDDQSIELMVFSGEGTLLESDRKVGPGEGLRFFDIGEPEVFVARDEAHRLPDSIPVVSPAAYGDNLVKNHSFEVGLLSRSCKTERLYRDIPLGWKAGWQKDGIWTDALEQHSGTVRITDAIGGLPTPVAGERYLWVNHGFIAQEIDQMVPGAEYELSLKVASHRNLGPGAGHLVRHVGGNVFQFGIWSGSEWIAETSGQLQAGQPFQEMKMKFSFPENGLPGMVPVLMLKGETRIFYDDVVLKKL